MNFGTVRAAVCDVAVEHGGAFDFDVDTVDMDITPDFAAYLDPAASGAQIATDTAIDLDPAAEHPGVTGDICVLVQIYAVAGEHRIARDCGLVFHFAAHHSQIAADAVRCFDAAAHDKDIAARLRVQPDAAAGDEDIALDRVADLEIAAHTDDVAAHLRVDLHVAAHDDDAAVNLGFHPHLSAGGDDVLAELAGLDDGPGVLLRGGMRRTENCDSGKYRGGSQSWRTQILGQVFHHDLILIHPPPPPFCEPVHSFVIGRKALSSINSWRFST